MPASALRAMYSLLAPSGTGARLSVLIFHRVLPAPDPLMPDEPTAVAFEARMRWLQRHFNLLPLAQAVARLKSGTLPARPLSITFDDGYADNAQIAAPILRGLGVPATFFIATGYLDGGCMFNDAIVTTVRDCQLSRLDLDELGLGVHSLTSTDDKLRAIAALLPPVKRMPVTRRTAVAGRICELARVPAPGNLMMTTTQVMALVRDGFDIGAHTQHHPILADLDDDAAHAEIDAGRRRLQEITQARVGLFAYPNGRPQEDYTARTAELVRKMGFDAAFTTAHGSAGRDADLYQLPRFTPWDRGDLGFGLRMARNLMNAAFPRVASQ